MGHKYVLVSFLQGLFYFGIQLDELGGRWNEDTQSDIYAFFNHIPFGILIKYPEDIPTFLPGDRVPREGKIVGNAFITKAYPFLVDPKIRLRTGRSQMFSLLYPVTDRAPAREL
jgi:hypothetical protein